MKISWFKKNEYWQYFIERYFIFGEGGGYGVTGPRLRKIKEIVEDNDDFWQDIILRHGGLDRRPDELREQYPDMFEHCQGNFWGMIYQTLIDKQIIKK